MRQNRFVKSGRSRRIGLGLLAASLVIAAGVALPVAAVWTAGGARASAVVLLGFGLLIATGRVMGRELEAARSHIAELEDSKALLLETLDSLEQRVAVLDRRGRTLQANAAARRYIEDRGSDPTSVASVFLSEHDVAPGDPTGPARAAWEGLHAVLTGARKEFQLEYPSGDGDEERWSLLRVRRTDTESGEPLHVVVAQEDITERVQTARALRRSEAHFRNLVGSMSDLVVALDRELRHTGIYGKWAEAAGLTPERFMGRLPREVLESTAAAALEGAGRRALRREHVHYRSTLTNETAGRHVETAVSPIRDDEGAIVGVVGVGRDVTERVRAENASRRRDAILRAVGAASQRFLRNGWERTIEDALAEIGRATDASRAYLLETEPATGHAAAAGPAHVWHAHGVVPVDGVESAPPLGRLDAWRTRLAEGETIAVRCGEAVGPAKEYLQTHGVRSTVLVPVFAGEQWVGCLGLEDGTEDRLWSELEIEALMAAADTLGAAIDRKRIEEALREREEQLRQSQKMEAIGQLAGGIAHDFNNLLTAIQGRTALLLSEPVATDHIRSDLDEIREAAERAATLTRQLLAFSRRQVLEPKALDLNHTVRDVETMLRRLIGEDVVLITRPAPALGIVMVDPNNMVQVLMNLVVNARDAMPDGGMIVISTANQHVATPRDVVGDTIAPGAYVALEVSDTGTGIPEALRERIFEPFFTTKGPGNGTGLGLSMIYGIVRQSGGYIELESEADRGTTFRVLLPHHEAAAEAAPTIVEPEQEPGPGSETVLLAEDEAAVRSLIRRVLERNGYSVLEASNGAEAIQIALNHAGPIDLLLTDVVMPDLDGPELAERLDSIRPRLPVVFMSGYTDREILRRGTEGVQAAFLAKPFSPDYLARKIREVLDAAVAAP